RVDVFLHAVQQVHEILQVGHFHVLLVAELVDHRVHVAAAQLPRVQRLQRAAAGARARLHVDALAHASLPYRLAISSAAMAASAPLLPALVPERSIACSMLSVVRTPNATGTPDA